MTNMFTKLIKRFMYQKKGSHQLRCYEAALIYAFRSALSETNRKKFDESWKTHDEVMREQGDTVFWTWCWESSCGGATLESHPEKLRMFGTQGSGSVKVGSVRITPTESRIKSISVDVYFADGIGPTFYFKKGPKSYFDAESLCMEVGASFDGIDIDGIPFAKAVLLDSGP